MKLDKAKSWHYQLQKHVRLDRTEDVLVMDIDADPKPYLTKPDGLPRAVLAYLSIGEAEDYRLYWTRAMERKITDNLIIGENPDWPSNYSVKFWDAGWQAIIQDEAKRAQAKGFTGLYLDKADVVDDVGGDDRMWRKMVDFIRLIARTVPDMDIVLQNAERLLFWADLQSVLAGTAHEDVLYGDPTDGHRNDHGQIHERLTMIEAWRGPKFAVEYIDDRATARRAVRDLKFYGFVPLVADQDRSLGG